MRSALSLVLAGALSVGFSTPTSAAVLCKSRSGVIVVREACKKKEAPLDLSQFGAVGPAGPKGLAGWERPCPPDSVLSGTTCIDKFEASVWRVPDPLTSNADLVAKIQQGTATAADLATGGAQRVGGIDNYPPCAENGENCADVYAVSLPGTLAAGSGSWFQAQQACKNARKRLPWNAEWQAAAVGTPDPGPDNGATDCNTAGVVPILTGARSSCVSSDGAFDMVGNLGEWVAEWKPITFSCGEWGGNLPFTPTSDIQCLGGQVTTSDPGGISRGGNYSDGVGAGPLAINSNPLSRGGRRGFRCAR